MSPHSLDPRIGAAFERDPQNGFPLDGALLMACRTGSIAQNTQLPAAEQLTPSDEDLRGIVVPPAHYVLGLDRWKGHWRWSCDADPMLGTRAIDVHLFSLEKFLGLAIDANPAALEWLWLAPEHYLVTTPAWTQILAARTACSSRLAFHTFTGMVRGGLTRLVASSHGVFAEEARYQKLTATLTRWGVSLVAAQSGTIVPHITSTIGVGFDAEHTRLATTTVADYARLHAERTALSARGLPSTAESGPKRRATIETHAYDVNAAMHMVRIATMIGEFLETGVLRVYRTTDAAELHAVKRGARSLADVIAHIEALLARADRAVRSSPLPEAPNRAVITTLMEQITRAQYRLDTPLRRTPTR
jgi:hypothetical protein